MLKKKKKNHEMIIAAALCSSYQFAEQSNTACRISRSSGCAESRTHWAYADIYKREKYIENQTRFLCCPICLQKTLHAPKSIMPPPPNGTIAVQNNRRGSALSSAPMPHPETLEVKWHHRDGSSGQVLIEIWMNRSERMNSTMNDPPITTQQSCLALMNS